MQNKEFNGLTLITTISCENGKVYLLYSDGNLYEKSKNGNHRKLDRLNSENREIIKTIMEKLRPAKTDVIIEEKRKTKVHE